MLKCVRRKDIRFPIDRATKHTCRAELFFCGWHLCISRRSLIRRSNGRIIRPSNGRSLSSFSSADEIILSFLSGRVPPLARVSKYARVIGSVKDIADYGSARFTRARSAILHFVKEHPSLRNGSRAFRIHIVGLVTDRRARDHAIHRMRGLWDPTWMNTVK